VCQKRFIVVRMLRSTSSKTRQFDASVYRTTRYRGNVRDCLSADYPIVVGRGTKTRKNFKEGPSFEKILRAKRSRTNIAVSKTVLSILFANFITEKFAK